MNLKVFLSDTFDPWFNLATEDYIFNDMDANQNVLFLWRNENTVVIGRFQNPWSECNLEKMEQDGIKLARRQSGGGAVFHDLGNTNFTFMSAKDRYSKDTNNKIITNALLQYDIKASTSGRNDIVVDERKISGAAFKESKDRAFHHGTLLINADLTKLANYLTPNEKKLKTKGITSVRARVANLVEFNPQITHENLSDSIIQEFFKTYGNKCEVTVLNSSVLAEIPELKKRYEALKDWSWRFGETPEFQLRIDEKFDWGYIDVYINSEKGSIKDIKIFSDSLHPEMIELLNQQLKDIPFSESGIQLAINKTIEELPMIQEYLREFGDWMIKSIK